MLICAGGIVILLVIAGICFGYDEDGNPHDVPEVLIIPLRPPALESTILDSTPTPTSTHEPTPGSGTVFAMAGILLAMYFIKR